MNKERSCREGDEIEPFWPAVQAHQGKTEPGSALLSSTNQALSFDTFRNVDGNFHLCVAGQPGSGKTQLVMHLLRDYLAKEYLVWVIDSYGCYRAFCEEGGGRYFSVRDHFSDLSLNPFSFLTCDCDRSYLDLIFLFRVFSQMIAGNERLEEVEIRALEEAIYTVYSTAGRAGTPRDVARLLAESPKVQSQVLAKKLFLYTEGRYSVIFNRSLPLEMTHPFMVFGLEGFECDQELRLVVVMILLQRFYQEMWMNFAIIQIPKMIVFDEIEEYFCGDKRHDLVDFINGIMRISRHRYGGLCVVAQGLDLFYTKMSSGGGAIVEDSDHVVLLPHCAESIWSLRRGIRTILSETGLQALETLESGDRTLSNLLLLGAGTFKRKHIVLKLRKKSFL